jgi:hypothetical protein
VRAMRFHYASRTPLDSTRSWPSCLRPSELTFGLPRVRTGPECSSWGPPLAFLLFLLAAFVIIPPLPFRVEPK